MVTKKARIPVWNAPHVEMSKKSLLKMKLGSWFTFPPDYNIIRKGCEHFHSLKY